MTIAILGAGAVGGTLGKRFAQVGHEVYFGVPHPQGEKSQTLLREIGAKARAGTVAEAAREAELILLAVPYDAVADALRECDDLGGKIVIDATNPLQFADGKLSLSAGFDTSGAEKIAQMANGARVVKCFNQTGFDNMREPQYAAGKNVMFVCGDDAQAVETVRELADSIGFEAVSAGDLKISRLLEPLAMLWIHLSFSTDLGRDFAFALVRRP